MSTAELATPALDQGQTRVWKFDETAPAKAGIDPRFEKRTVKNAKNIAFKQGPSQQITMTNTNAVNEDGKPGQANIQLAIGDIPVGNGDRYYKGWLSGNVFDSTNSALGFCGQGDFQKGEFHTQLQLSFMKDNRALGICYCNLCPAKDGHGQWCATDQWQVGGDDPPKLSNAGACKAPQGTNHVLVTLEAIAKGDAQIHHRGTAVFKKAVVGRCNNDGTCPDSMTPNDYGN